MNGEAEMVASFFARLDRLDNVVRVIVSEAPLRARFTIRSDRDRTVLLDLTGPRARTVLDDDSLASDIVVTMTAEAWHAVLSGALKPGEALGRREMLLRGSAAHLASFIPLFDFAPMLYREHRREAAGAREVAMNDDSNVPHARRWLQARSARDKLYNAANEAAFALGWGLGMARRRFDRLSLFALLEAMSKGMEAASRTERNDAHG